MIISDSRGKLLKSQIYPPPGFNVQFEVQNGLTLIEAKDIVQRKLEASEHTCVYIMAGICSVTLKEEGFVYLPFKTKEDIVEAVTGTAWSILNELDRLFTTPVVLCTFPGVDLIRANNKNAQGHHPQQDLLNEAMIEINDYLVELNLSRSYPTLMLCTAIHRGHKTRKDSTTKYRHHYCRLDDGIHPTQSTLDFWTKRFKENVGHFTLNKG